MLRFWLHWDVVSCGAAISDFEKGLPLVMRRCWLQPNVISYGAAITYCEKSQSWDQALSLMREMRCFDVDPNVREGRLCMCRMVPPAIETSRLIED